MKINKGLSYVRGWNLGKVHKKDPYREETLIEKGLSYYKVFHMYVQG